MGLPHRYQRLSTSEQLRASGSDVITQWKQAYRAYDSAFSALSWAFHSAARAASRRHINPVSDYSAYWSYIENDEDYIDAKTKTQKALDELKRIDELIAHNVAS